MSEECQNCGHPRVAGGFGVLYVHSPTVCTYLDSEEHGDLYRTSKSCPCPAFVAPAPGGGDE
jgi:hypothetical protein